jgi:hypothetical protein
MRLEKDNVYLFHDVDKHGTIVNQTSGMFVEDFTLLTRVKPDFEHINSVLRYRQDSPDYPNAYLKQCIVGKNGKHTGLFLTSFINYNGDIQHMFEYEWWQNPRWEETKDSSLDEVKNISILVDTELETSFDIVSSRIGNTLNLTVNSQTIAGEIDCMIDYSQSLTWLGTANMLIPKGVEVDEDFVCIFTGEIELLHMQDTPLDKETIGLFFTDFYNFLNLKLDVRENTIYFTSNFSQTTPYKVRDFSGNGLHPLVFNHEWIGEEN